MAQASQYSFEFKELAELMVKKLDLHEGLWAISVEFGIGASNIGPSPTELRPSAIIPIVKIGLIQATESTNLAVDAAQVNPAKDTRLERK
jgi:hypothetical protein